MSSVDVAAINARLARLYSNGRQEVGLEVGADAGLVPNEYIQVPRSMLKKWAYCNVASGSGTPPYARTETDTVSDLRNKSGWAVIEATNSEARVITYEGKFFTKTYRAGTPKPISDFLVEPCTYDDLRRFLIANQGHIRDDQIQLEKVHYVHAARFWSLTSGLVMGDKNVEYTVVDDPTSELAAVDTLAQQVLGLMGESVTAAAARATSWRKTNHASGGEIATGFPRRWLEQNGHWTNQGTAAEKSASNKNATTMFYVATHGVAVHNVLALMAHSDPGHWASIDPRCGLAKDWDVKESTAVRIAPMTQVAGVAMVVDSVVVLSMLVSEGLVPLLENISQWRTLVDKHNEVKSGGVAIATYAGWFLEGHPNGVPKKAFSQKSADVSDIIGELSAVATNYYRRSTIGQSPALENAARQLASTGATARWASLARERNASTNTAAVAAYRRITGSAAGKAISQLASEEEPEVEEGVNNYNSIQDLVGQALGIANPPNVKTSDLMKLKVNTSAPGPDPTGA